MKCNHCKSEWTVNPEISKSLTNCPFCGTSLLPEPKKPETVEDVLVEIYNRFGAAILADEAKLMAFFSDLAPNLAKQRKILGYFVECGGPKKLFSVEKASEQEQLVCIRQIVKEMNDEMFIEVAASQMICDAFLFAITGRRLQETGTDAAKDQDSVVSQVIRKEPITNTTDVSKPSMETDFQQAEDYFHGTATVPQDYQKAFACYTKAAKQGHALARFKLGNGYETGVWGQKDQKTAFHWYNLAAKKDCAPAQYHLGRCYALGRGTRKNSAQAFKWYQAAANAENADAMAALGGCYHAGTGVEKNKELAFDLCEKAIRNGSPLGITEMSKIFAGKKPVVENLCLRFMQAIKTQEQAMAQELKNSGYNMAVHMVRYPSTKAEGANIMMQCAEAGNINAQLWVGQAYHVGLILPKDPKKAVHWIQKAANQRNAAAKELLRQINGIDLSKNRVNALVKKYQLGNRYLCSVSPQFTVETNKAIKSYAISAYTETPVLMEDTTVFRSGKEGFLLTATTLYYNGGLFGSKGKYPVDKTKSISATLGSINNIYLDIAAVKGKTPSARIRISYTSDRNEAQRIQAFWSELLSIPQI